MPRETFCTGPSDDPEVPCGGKVADHGLCPGHRKQQRLGRELVPLRAKRPASPEGYWWCSREKKHRPLADFGWDTTRDQPKRLCLFCTAAVQRASLDDTANGGARRARHNRKVMLAKWGITDEQYQHLFDAQGHRCAICGAERRDHRNLAIDHDHVTGAFRGLLCQDCNLGIGQLADDPDRLEAAARYLRAGGPLAGSGLRVPLDSPEHQRAQKRIEARRSRT